MVAPVMGQRIHVVRLDWGAASKRKTEEFKAAILQSVFKPQFT